jgi:capsular polysaccharide biosynthesis protein
MDMMELFRTLRKRWVLTALLLLASIAGGAYLAVKPGPYQSVSMVTLLPSRQASRPFGFNPYLSLNASLTLTSDLVRREVSDPRNVLALAKLGYSAPFVVADDPATAGPVLDITVTGPNKAMVEHTLYGVTAEVQQKLTAMQANVKPVDQIRSLTVSVQPKATLLITKKLRIPIALFAVGLVITAAVPQLVETFWSARRSRRDPVAVAAPPARSAESADSLLPPRRPAKKEEAEEGEDSGWRSPVRRTRPKAERSEGNGKEVAEDFDYLYD